MMQTMIRVLFGYNQWAYERVWTCLLTLDEAQFTQPFDYSIGSVRNQIVHVMSVDNRWLHRVADQPVPAHFRPEDFASPAAVRAQWEPLAAAQRAIVDGLSAAQLSERIGYDMPKYGGLKQTARWEILAHVVNHGTDHRAQILSLLGQMGAPTVEQDLIYYVWENAAQ